MLRYSSTKDTRIDLCWNTAARWIHTLIYVEIQQNNGYTHWPMLKYSSTMDTRINLWWNTAARWIHALTYVEIQQHDGYTHWYMLRYSSTMGTCIDLCWNAAARWIYILTYSEVQQHDGHNELHGGGDSKEEDVHHVEDSLSVHWHQVDYLAYSAPALGRVAYCQSLLHINAWTSTIIVFVVIICVITFNRVLDQGKLVFIVFDCIVVVCLLVSADR